tara:strand:+ start:1501 stop:1845 length:345 start_codon:yes stop_codon:yes gene_type:complete
MKLIYIFAFLIYSGNILAKEVNIDTIEKNKFNLITQELCIDIDKKKLEHYKKMACLEILEKGVKKDNFYSIYLLHKALKSKINFNKDYDLSVLENKLKNKKDLSQEELNLLKKL